MIWRQKGLQESKSSAIWIFKNKFFLFMNYLSVEKISKSFGDRVLFQDVSFGVEMGQKVALVAKNGEGKTTFLDILAEKAMPDSGTAVWRNGIRVAYLSQQDQLKTSLTIKEALFEHSNIYMDAIEEYQAALENTKDADRYQKALDKMESLQAWDYEVKFQQILGALGLHNLNVKIDSLSGGQKKRLALAKVLIEEPDFLILDEPTNHLDVEMIEWLEDYLSSDKLTLLMVTHDRYFLDRVCDHIIELDNQQLYSYRGNYSYYIEKKAEREDIEKSEIAKAKNLYRKELDWVRRMPKARGTKSKSRVDSFYETEKVAKKRISDDEVRLEIKSERLGNKILELHHVSKSFDDLKILDDFSYTFKRGEKIGIAGKNGVGKTTFLNLIMGLEKLDKGKIVVGETIQFGYFTQKGIQLDDDKRIIEVVKDIAEFIPLAKGRTLSASQLLERFLFPPKQQYSYVSKLSGGEKRRLYLLTVLMSNPNFLILDEPTNDLDIQTLAILEDFLLDFGGCLLVVSHDRYFMDKLADHIFVFQGEGKIKDFNGLYSEWLKVSKEKEAPGVKKMEEKPSAAISSTAAEKGKLGFNEKRELKQLEKEIEKLENQKTELEDALSSGSLEPDQINQQAKELSRLIETIEKKSDRWLELSDLE